MHKEFGKEGCNKVFIGSDGHIHSRLGVHCTDIEAQEAAYDVERQGCPLLAQNLRNAARYWKKQQEELPVLEPDTISNNGNCNCQELTCHLCFPRRSCEEHEECKESTVGYAWWSDLQAQDHGYSIWQGTDGTEVKTTGVTHSPLDSMSKWPDTRYVKPVSHWLRSSRFRSSPFQYRQP